MDKSYMFMRGQIWYWEDPLYGRKERHEEPTQLDACLRFSRYVLVAQTTESINPISVMVIPCSSGDKNEYSVKLPLNHGGFTNNSFARVDLMFPAHPKSLLRYVCTLSDSVMEKIDNRIANLLFPGSPALTIESEDEAPHQTPEIPEVKKRNRRSRWDTSTIDRFMELYDTNGIESVCEEFDIKPVSAKKYYIKWTKENRVPKKINQETVDPIEIELYGCIDIQFIVSKVSNLINEEFRNRGIFTKVRKHLTNNKKSSDEFYKDLGNSIYHTLINFIGIKKEGDEFIIPKLPKIIENIETWLFLDRLYNDNNISNIEEVDMIIQAYIHYYGDNTELINHEWLNLLYQKIIAKVGINHIGATAICSRIDKSFCRININKKSS